MLQPLGDRVVIKFDKKDEEVTKFGIIIPGTAIDKPDDGVVAAVGPGKYSAGGTFIPTTVKVGDRVLFSKFAAQIVTVDKQEFLTMSEDNIVGIIK